MMPVKIMPYHQFTIRLAEKLHDPLIRVLHDAGSLGVIEADDSVIAYFPLSVERSSVEAALAIAGSLLADASGREAVTFEHALLADQDWNTDWKKNFPPVDIGQRFSSRPPWATAAAGRIPLIIDPGMAFGTGHHETTRSCLVLMERFSEEIRRERFLDVGTGTGLLAVAALKLGFRAVEAIDTDPLAIEAAKHNLQLNGAESIALIEGEIGLVSGAYDMIAANLISGTLVHLAEDIASRIAGGGIAILSGILAGQEPEVIAAMERAGLLLREALRDGKWVTLGMGS